MKYKVLIADYDALIRETLATCLKEYFEISVVDSGEKALKLFYSQPFELILLDVDFHGHDGFEIIKEMRKESQVPIMVYSARASVGDQIQGYGLGVDDYISKPCEISLILAKMQRILSRTYQEVEEVHELSFDQLVINKLSRTVKIEDEFINFRPKEFDLLIFLIDNQGVALNRDRILDAVWGIDYFGDTRVVDTHVKKIRKKLGKYAKCIHTIFGVGYKFEVIE